MTLSHSRPSAGPTGRSMLAALLAILCLLPTATAAAATLYANPGDSITSKINTMQPGDTLVLNPGTYNVAGVTMLLITNKVGREDAWFTVKAAQPGTVVIQGNSGRNMCEMRNSAYWRFENLEFDGRNVASDGIKATVNTGDPNTDWCHHIVLENMHFHNLGNAAVNTQVTVWDLVVRNCWFHDVGLAGYLGSPGHVQQILNLTWENNLIERTYGYGVQVKAQNVRSGLTLGTTPGLEFDSWGWSIRHNVWMRTSPPASSARPNLLVDAAPASGAGSDEIAVIEGNVVLEQTGDSTSDHAFQLSGNLRIANNILMNVKGGGLSGIRIGFHDITYPRRLEIVNNTVFINDPAAARCLSLADIQAGYTQVIANNAFIRGNTGAQAVVGSVPAGAIVTNNIVRGTGAIAGMTTIDTPLAQIFVNPVETPGLANLYPVAGSPLIGAGSNTYTPDLDFNGVNRVRGGAAEAGAYELYTDHNPGWQLAVGLKEQWTPGDVNGDGQVNMTDVMAIAASWNTRAGSPGFDEVCDLDLDGAVNIFDIFVVAENWGG